MTLAWWILPLLLAAGPEAPIRDPRAPGDQAIVERGLVTLRLDPKRDASPGECDDLSSSELVVTIGGRRVPVTSLEHVPRPERHWLLLDISESAEGRRREAKRSAAEYARKVMSPGIDAAALLTIDEDTLLVAGPDTDPEAIARRIEAVPAGGSSALRDALDLVLRQVAGDRREQLVLYWTDGHDNTSLGRLEDLYETLARTPNATIFPIALMPTRSLSAGETPIGSFLFDVAKRSGGEVFASSDARWLDQVRGWIARRFAVAFHPPPEASGTLALSVPGKRCTITVLPDPFARPDAVAGSAAPPPAAWTRLHAKQRKLTDDTVCAAASEGAAWAWPLRSGPDRLAGCMLDVLSPPGALFGKRPVEWKTLLYGSVRVGARDIQVKAPELDRLPRSLVEALDLLVPVEGDDPHRRSPHVVEGSALLAQRARIASSLFATRGDYRDFALQRLHRMAREDLVAIERDLRRAFPDLPEADLNAVARASRAGRRIVEATRTPTDADLARVLAAWLGDVPAQDLLREWERRLINRKLGGSAVDAAPRWKRLRDRWAMPQQLRVAAPLVLVRDPERDIVGFWRVVLPRPEWFSERAAAMPASADRPEDRLPEHPLGLWLVDEIGANVLSRLAEYACSGIDYESMDPAWRSTPEHPYRRLRVALAFERKDATLEATRAVVQAEFELLPEAPVRLADLAFDVDGDDDLDKALAEARGRLVEVQAQRGAGDRGASVQVSSE